MSSPRSMWSGNLAFGLLNVPVSIGKAWSDVKESSLVDLCSCHSLPVDRTERCQVATDTKGTAKTVVEFLKARDLTGALTTLTHKPEGKVKGVRTDDGFRKFAENEWNAIEDATKSDSLTILDVQPVHELPMEYGTGTYYVRYNPPKKGSTAGLDGFANFVAALRKDDRAVIVKWCKSARQQLAFIHATSEGLLLLTTIPFDNEWRAPGDKEKAHTKVETSPEVIEMMGTLLDAASRETGFRHDDYRDEGLKLRTEAVDKILGGEKLQEKGEQKSGGDQTRDLMADLRASMDKIEADQKEKA